MHALVKGRWLLGTILSVPKNDTVHVRLAQSKRTVVVKTGDVLFRVSQEQPAPRAMPSALPKPTSKTMRAHEGTTVTCSRDINTSYGSLLQLWKVRRLLTRLFCSFLCATAALAPACRVGPASGTGRAL